LQGVAPKYRARGWPALWKIASVLDHLAPVIPLILYTLAQNPVSLSGQNSTVPGTPVQNRFSFSDFDAANPVPMGQSQI